MTIFTRTASGGLAALAVLCCLLALAGGPLVPVWVVAVLSLFVLFRRWIPTSLSLALSVGIFFGLELLLLRVTPLLHLGGAIPNAAAWSTLGAVVGLLGVVKPAPIRLERSMVWLALSSATGAVVFVTAMALAQVLPGALRLSWAMNGDAVNAMGFARRMVADGGIDPASTPQPTPLPFAMAAASMESGRSSVAVGDLLEHDVARTAQVWVFVIALTCLLVGVIVARSVRQAALAWSIPVVAVASLSSLSWYVIGVQFDFGFMNSGFAIMLLLCAWLAYAGGERRPVALLTALFVVALGLLAVWSPLVICLVGLGVVTLVRDRNLIGPAGWRLGAPLLSLLLLAGYALSVTLPGFVQQSDALGNDGGFPPIGPGSILVITTLTLLAAGLTAHAGVPREPTGAIAVIAGFVLGLGYLLLQREGAQFGWGYYPAKFAWTTSVLLLVILIAAVARLMSLMSWSGRWRFVATGMAGLVIASLLWGPVAPRSQVPLAGILRGDAAARVGTDIVFELAGSHNGSDVLWRTNVGDFWPNTWLLQIDQPSESPVKINATIPVLSAAQVCAIIEELGAKTVVHTSDPAARGELEATCPSAAYSLVEGEY